MHQHLHDRLVALRNRDAQVRTSLAADGSLFEGYHPRMEAVHRQNAEALRAIIAAHGWPDEAMVGVEGAEAAWLIVQHSIGEPDFMRQCRALIDEASEAGRAPRWQFACIDDRIRVFEGKAQRFGTQFDLTPQGAELNVLEDPAQVDAWRHAAGLGPIGAVPSEVQHGPLPSPDEYRSKQAQGDVWRRQVGWLP